MSQVCFYLHMHQPNRIKNFNVFDIGHDSSYFESNEKRTDNKKIFLKVAKKSYLPMLTLLREILEESPGFRFALSLTGTFIEQSLAFQPKIIKIIKDMVETERLEILAETYYHSLAFLYSKEEFHFQIKAHSNLINDLFGVEPQVFRNTELIYANWIADLVSDFNFLGILTEGVDRYLHGRSRTQVFLSHSQNQIPLLLKHARLSDDIAFRFSNRNWPMYPLFVDKYIDWIEVYPESNYINLFMDFETFGEHHWEDTGIFLFFKKFVHEFATKDYNSFKLPSEIFQNYQSKKSQAQLPIYDVPELISWADVDRSITAWRDNSFQQDALEHLYSLRKQVLASEDKDLIKLWRKLQASDHFYYMCTKWSADGDVHAYFSPYKDPYEAYRRYSIVLADLKERLLE